MEVTPFYVVLHTVEGFTICYCIDTDHNNAEDNYAEARTRITNGMVQLLRVDAYTELHQVTRTERAGT